MHLLLESHEPKTTPLGVVISLGVHALLAFVVITAYRQGVTEDRSSPRRIRDVPRSHRAPGVRRRGTTRTRTTRAKQGEGKKSREKGEGGAGQFGRHRALFAHGGRHGQLDAAHDRPADAARRFRAHGNRGGFRGQALRVERGPGLSASRCCSRTSRAGAFVIYVVDTLGVADTTSFKVVRTTHDDVRRGGARGDAQDALPSRDPRRAQGAAAGAAEFHVQDPAAGQHPSTHR